MGAGNTPAGLYPAGLDPTSSTVAPTVTLPTQALFFDPASRTFPTTADGSGQLQRVHWVDAAVTHALAMKFGTIGSVPDQGAKFYQRKRIIPSQAEQIATDDANAALADLIAAGHIEIVSVVVVLPVAGRELVAVTYKNLRAPRSATTLNRTAQQAI